MCKVRLSWEKHAKLYKIFGTEMHSSDMQLQKAAVAHLNIFWMIFSRSADFVILLPQQ